MPDEYVIPDPEPKAIDERLAIELRQLAENARWCQWWETPSSK